MDREVHEYENFARENAKDILALGFDPDRTFLFSDYSYMGGDFYRNITRIAKVRPNHEDKHAPHTDHLKRINRGTADACFGFDSGTNIGKVGFRHVTPFKIMAP